MATKTDQERIEQIERHYHERQKITDGDLRWLFARVHRLVVADQILQANGYVIVEPGYRRPIEERM